MKHLIISREYPPAAYAPGGIGTYVANIARLMAERGELVHVIGERWFGATAKREELFDGRLIVHRLGKDDLPTSAGDLNRLSNELEGLKATDFPHQWFSWHAALLAEQIIDHEGIHAVEAQDWEAPLYYLLLRRTLGFGPRQVPACILHLHSATRFIQHYNGLPSTPGIMLMKRMEEYCIRAADALLCPSNTYADLCATTFGVPRASIKVIPLPMGSIEVQQRTAAVWKSGGICFVGRLEFRKGIVEWIQAAARVAREDRRARFDFVGGDVLGIQSALNSRLDRNVRSRFRFHGSKPRRDLWRHLAESRAGVVPSRWENFPNVCIEAMGSGLPVIATRFGGMAEMIEDGRTGWLARDTGVTGMADSLTDALRRCLSTSPHETEAMGLAAAESVRKLCDNDSIVEEHVAFRAEVAARGAVSVGVLPHSRLLQVQARPDCTNPGDPTGAAIVVRSPTIGAARQILESLQAQTVAPRAVLVVCSDEAGSGNHDVSTDSGIVTLFRPDLSGTSAWNAGYEALQGNDFGFHLFLDEHDRLAPYCLERLGSVFAFRPNTAVIAVWTWQSATPQRLQAPPCAEPVYQLFDIDVTAATAFRGSALGKGPPFRAGLPRDYDLWDLTTQLLLKGWEAVTLPEALAERTLPDAKMSVLDASALRAVRSEILARFTRPDISIALEVVENYVPIPLAPAFGEVLDPLAVVVFRRLVIAVRDPRRTLIRILARSGKACKRSRRGLGFRS
jgi:glycogen synthase